MEIHSIVLIAVVAALVGAVAAYLIFHRRGTVNDDGSSSRRVDDYDPSKDEEIASQKKEIEGLNNKIDKLKQSLNEAQDFKDLLKSGDENVKLSAISKKIEKLKEELEIAEEENGELEREKKGQNKSAQTYNHSLRNKKKKLNPLMNGLEKKRVNCRLRMRRWLRRKKL